MSAQFGSNKSTKSQWESMFIKQLWMCYISYIYIRILKIWKMYHYLISLMIINMSYHKICIKGLFIIAELQNKLFCESFQFQASLAWRIIIYLRGNYFFPVLHWALQCSSYSKIAITFSSTYITGAASDCCHSVHTVEKAMWCVGLIIFQRKKLMKLTLKFKQKKQVAVWDAVFIVQ